MVYFKQTRRKKACLCLQKPLPLRRDAPLVINTDTIRYIQMKRNYAEVHLTNGAVFTSRITMEELEQHLGDDFIKIHRSCLVAVRAIHNVEDTVVLNSGEQLEYVVRQKKRILEQL